MADGPLKFEYRISREASFYLAFGSLILAISAIWAALTEPYGLSRWEWVSQSIQVLLYGAGSVVLARWSLRGFLANKRKTVYVELTKDQLKVPWLFSVGSITDTDPRKSTT